jgi:hypothetical protein
VKNLNQESLIGKALKKEVLLETAMQEFVISNPSPTLYYEPIVSVEKDGWIPVSVGFSTYSISTKCYQCRFTSPTEVRLGFCVGNGDMGNLATGDVGRINVLYLRLREET